MTSSRPDALSSECCVVPLSLSHELRVDWRRFTAGGPFMSCWFGHPEGDPDRLWRLYVCPGGPPGAAAGRSWALHLQLSSAEERGQLFSRQPRAASVPEGSRSQTSYILTGVEVKVVFRSGRSAAVVERPAAARANFRVLGYLDTVQPVLVTTFQEKWGGGGQEDAKHLIIQLAFSVDYHKQAAVA